MCNLHVYVVCKCVCLFVCHCMCVCLYVCVCIYMCVCLSVHGSVLVTVYLGRFVSGPAGFIVTAEHDWLSVCIVEYIKIMGK